MDSEADLVASLVEQVQAQINAQLQGDDALDLKALGVLGANAAGIGLLVASHNSIPLWWLAVLLLAAGGVALLAVVWPLDLDNGPGWGQWYVEFGGEDPLEAARQMLSDLLATLGANTKATANKGSMFRLGFILTVAGFGASALVALLR